MRQEEKEEEEESSPAATKTAPHEEDIEQLAIVQMGELEHVSLIKLNLGHVLGSGGGEEFEVLKDAFEGIIILKI